MALLMRLGHLPVVAQGLPLTPVGQILMEYKTIHSICQYFSFQICLGTGPSAWSQLLKRGEFSKLYKHSVQI